MFFVVVGILKGRWKDIEHSPLHCPLGLGGSPAAPDPDGPVDLDADDPLDEDRGPPGADGDVPTTMAASNRALKKSRANMPSSLDFSVKVMSNKRKYRAAIYLTGTSLGRLWKEECS